jgi:hypothetical protein
VRCLCTPPCETCGARYVVHTTPLGKSAHNVFDTAEHHVVARLGFKSEAQKLCRSLNTVDQMENEE